MEQILIRLNGGRRRESVKGLVYGGVWRGIKEGATVTGGHHHHLEHATYSGQGAIVDSTPFSSFLLPLGAVTAPPLPLMRKSGFALMMTN